MPTLDEIQQKFPHKPTKRFRNRILKPALSSVDCLTSSWSLRDNGGSDCHGCDIPKVVQFFGFLKNKCGHNSDLDRTVKEALQDLISNLPKRSASKEELRVYLILPACHLMTDSKMYDSITYPFACSFKNLDERCQQILDDWLKAIPLNHLRRLVMVNERRDENLPEMLFHVPELCAYSRFITEDFICYLILKNLNRNQAQMIEMRGGNLPEMSFHATELSAQSQMITDNSIQHLENRHPYQAQLHFCQFPFLFNGELKHALVRIFNRITMLGSGIERNFFDQSLFLISSRIFVDRRNIIEDTMRQLLDVQSQDENVFKRELTVRFKGENDYGPGVNREFFTLILQRLLSRSFGLFTRLDESARVVWFHQEHDFDLNYYHFAGFMLGLALYNSQLISIPFPLAVFKKLLGIRTDFRDLGEIRPEVAKNLLLLLDIREAADVEDLSLSFEVTQRKRGKSTNIELCENGKNIPVTTNNRNDYVRLMVDFYLNKETAEEFEQFNKGFHEAFDCEILKILRIKPSELRSVFVGHEKIDTALLEKNAVYEGGYNHNSQTIRIFWDIIHSLSQEDVKRFVYFVTGSERISHSGLKIKIHPRPALIGEKIEDVKPEALTCFQQLLLPDNPDKERLRERLFSSLDDSPEFTDANELFRRIQVRRVMWT